MPELEVPAIKVKVDTGARTSALHTFKIEAFTQNSENWVRFWIHPLQKNETLIRQCEAHVKDSRIVSDSGGHKEERYVIETPVRIGDKVWPIEITLTNRDTMRFRMLLGRQAMQNHTAVDPSDSFINGRLKAKQLYGLNRPLEN